MIQRSAEASKVSLILRNKSDWCQFRPEPALCVCVWGCRKWCNDLLTECWNLSIQCGKENWVFSWWDALPGSVCYDGLLKVSRSASRHLKTSLVTLETWSKHMSCDSCVFWWWMTWWTAINCSDVLSFTSLHHRLHLPHLSECHQHPSETHIYLNV